MDSDPSSNSRPKNAGAAGRGMAVVFLLMAVLLPLSAHLARRNVVLIVDGEPLAISTFGTRVQDVLLEATAYCPGTVGTGCPREETGASLCTGSYNDGFTATGRLAVAGTGQADNPHIIAVDPLIIPLGSRLYIEGMGYALAADVGGAIVGKRIDILFDRHEAARNFGRRPLRVYLLP